jgi:hypothetical protein
MTSAQNRLVRNIVRARLEVHDRLEGGMGRRIQHAFAVDPDLAPIAQPGAIFVPGPDHACPSLRLLEDKVTATS